jgi:hypothetical protein
MAGVAREKIECFHSGSRGIVDYAQAAAAESCRDWICDRKGKVSRSCGVRGISAMSEHLGTRFHSIGFVADEETPGRQLAAGIAHH